jgi:2-dehydro-3-deoxyglucarate aldolase/4-hydroxy-2-oxoheptanedioate aldolase
MFFIPFKPALSGGDPVDLIWLALGSAALAGFAAHARPGAIVLDLQHGLWDRHSLEAAVGTAGRHVPVIARCAANTPHHIGQALDSGASSVLIPLVETAEDARSAVQAGRYPPAGVRSAGGVRPLLAGIEAMLEAGGHVAVGVMIETVQGVENVEAIAAVPGIDYMFIGTGDLALSRGTNDPEVIERDCRRVFEAAQERSIPCGIYTGTVEAAREAFGKGYKLAVCASDTDVARAGFMQATQGARA